MSGINCDVTGDSDRPEISITLNPGRGEDLMEMFTRLSAALNELDASILNLIVYGSVKSASPATEAMRRVFGAVDWPITWVEGAACGPGPIAGIQVFAIGGRKPDRVIVNNRVLGSVYEAGGARFCLLGGLGPPQHVASRGAQTEATFDELQDALARAGFTLGDTIRTWFFLEDLLSWYSEFNAVRTRLYWATKFRTLSLPASTGVAGKNPAGKALTVGAWAMRPISRSARAGEIASPLQCPAPAYGSSFSRAIEISQSGGRRLLISGTASIAPEGQTLWQNNAKRQIELTMEVVEAILQSRGFSLADTTRATAYFKNKSDTPEFTRWCLNHRASLPFVPVECDICRDDLLFELELDAWKSRRREVIAQSPSQRRRE